MANLEKDTDFQWGQQAHSHFVHMRKTWNIFIMLVLKDLKFMFS